MTAPNHSVTGSLAGATFAFQTDAPDLAAYATAHLAPLAAGAVSMPAVTAALTWHDGQPPAERRLDRMTAARLERVDRDVYTDGTTLHWFRVDDLRDLFLRFTWNDGRLTVHGDFYYRLGNSPLSDRIRRARRWSQRAELRQRRFTTLLYYLVYYPCWWWLEHTRDFHPIHAAAVTTDAGVILLAGASGVGKSTVAVALALSPGVRLLSDSFVLHHGDDVWAVHEPILLDAWSRHWLGAAAEQLPPIDGYFGLERRGYQMPPQHLTEGGRAALILFPRRTAEPYVRRISAEQAHQRLSAADLMINDLRRYWAFAAVLEQLQFAGFAARREAHLARLVADARCYEIGLAADTTSTAAVHAIMQLMQEQPLRVAGSRQ
jgi:hypothetical protein